MKAGFQIKGEIETKYPYDHDLTTNLTKVIAFYFRKELLSKSTILKENTIEFENSKFNWAPFNFAITIFNFSIDRGIVTLLNKSGRLVLDYKVTFVKGLIFLYAFVGLLAFPIIRDTDFILFSEETLVFLVLPPAFFFLMLLIGLRIFNLLIDKSLENRYRKIKT
jgi:hypothetical protein